MTTDDDRFAIDALQSGDPQQLQEMAAVLDALEDGEDEAAWQRAVLHAIAAAPLATIDWLLDHGVDLASADEEGQTPLLAAVESTRDDRLEVLQRLIAAGAPLNGRGANGWTAAHLAASQDDVDVLRLLAEAGADLTLRGDGGVTPLDEAQYREMSDAVAFLESRAAASEDGSPYPGWKPVVEAGHLTLIQDMLSNHGIRSEIMAGGAPGKAAAQMLWVKATDHARAVDLVQQMAAALEAPAAGPWQCAGCGEENDGAFDACWQCGREHASG